MKPISSASPVYATGSDSRASPTSWVCAETVSSPSSKRSRSGDLRWRAGPFGGRRRGAPRAEGAPRPRTARGAAACSSGTARRSGGRSARRRRPRRRPGSPGRRPRSSRSAACPTRRELLSARAGTIASSSRPGPRDSVVSLTLSRYESVAGHHELLRLEAHEDPGEDRPRLVPRGRPPTRPIVSRNASRSTENALSGSISGSAESPPARTCSASTTPSRT